METQPMAWQEQGPVNSLDEGVNEFWAQGEVGATISHNSPQKDKKAPRAEPEEDIDILKPAAPDKTQQTLSRTKTPDATEPETQESTRINPCTPRETQEMVTELEQVAQLSEALRAQEESVDPCEDAFPPPRHLSISSTEECFERESFSSLEGEVAEWIGDAEIMSDPTEDLTSLDSQNSPEWPPLLTAPVRRVEEEEVTGDIMTTEVNGIQLNLLQDGFDNSEPENNMSEAVVASHHSPSDRNNLDDVYTVCSPPFADESEEEEGVSIDIMPCQQQWSTLDVRGEPFQPSNFALSTEPDPAFTPPAVPSAKQQEELLSQSQSELAPRGVNQEAAQQVLGQSPSPLSTVAMELSNKGGAASQGSAYDIAVRERHSRVGERAEGESKQTGGEGGQKELERKTVGQQHGRELFKFSVQTQVVKTGKHSFVSSKHTRMESDSCDDSQSDSGVSADFSPCSTLEGNTTISTGSPAAVPKETPIEREIRRAIEREHSLRRSRGLPNPPTSPEYVEIPLRKTVLCQSITSKPERCLGKDRQFAGKKMQHEIHEEAQREQDLVKLGKVPGFYDKGTVRQVKERKQLFEAFQKPSDSTLTVSARSKTTSRSSASDTSTLENMSLQATTIGGSNTERIRTQSPTLAKGGGSLTPRGPGFSEGTTCQIVILENNLSVPAQKLYHTKPEVNSGGPTISSTRTAGHGGIKVREQEEEEEEEETPKENPFFKLRSSTNLVKVEQDIREAREREKELHKQRVSLYGGTEGTKGGGRPGSTGKSPMSSSSPSSSSLNGLAVPDLPASSSRGGTKPTEGRQSVGKLGVWPPAPAEEEKKNWPEVSPQSPRTPRQKTPLVQRWESGLVNGHNTEDD